jgi:hypothetical protein
MKTKVCKDCKETLPIDIFSYGVCKPCYNKRRKAEYAIRKLDPAFRERRNAQARKSKALNPRSYERRKKEWLKSLYKMTIEDYDQLLLSQNSVCAVCQEKCKSTRGLAVDHDHLCCPGNKSCGKCIRGLLCSNCNRALGMFQDNPEILNRAIAYLTSPPK